MTTDKLLLGILWIARITGTLIIGFILFFLITHLFGNDESGAGFNGLRDILSFICFPVSTLAGLLLAWKWEGLGGLITTLGMIALFILRPDLLMQFYFLLLLIPGLLFLTYHLLRSRSSAS